MLFRSWKEVLLHQFHDILPGSSIGRVYVEAEKAHQEIQKGACEMKEKALAALADSSNQEAVTVWNSLSFERQALVELPERFEKGARTLEGEAVPVQKTAGTPQAFAEGDGQTKAVVKALVKIPSCGAVSLIPTDVCDAKAAEVSVAETAEGFVMENGKVRAVINRKGEVTSFILKKIGRAHV